uniref:Uncharacterized protein n=1 Tax=Magallana gigas TaxID=29159 RepID=A0A8W8JJ99_MAGGI
MTLEINDRTGYAYEDHFCAFRCLALHQGYDVKNFEGKTKQLFDKWTKFKGVKDFQGVEYRELSEFESSFEINVEVYALNLEGHVESVYKSRGRYEDTVYLHLYQALLHNVQDQSSEKVEWTHEHMPISVSICSNVPGFEEPHCLVNDNGDELVREMVGYMKDIAEKTELSQDESLPFSQLKGD